MTSTRAINAAAGVIHACIQQGKVLPASIAYALDSAGLLNSPEHAAEVEQLRTRVTELEARSPRVRTDELRPGDRVWHPYDMARFTVTAVPEELVPHLGFHNRVTDEFESGLRVTGTDDNGETVHVDAAPSYLWHRDSAAAELEQLRARVAELEAAAGDGSTRPVDEDPIAYSLTSAVEALHASSGAVIETPSRREQSSAKLRGLLARQQAAVEAAHETPPRPRPVPHDLPAAAHCPLGAHLPGDPCDDQCTTQARALAELRIRLEGGTP